VSCFRFIASVEADHAVALSCRVVGVSRAGYYAWRARQPEWGGAPSARARADGALLHHIRQIHTQSRGTYGSPRVHAELVDPTGTHRLRCARKRVARLMRQAGLTGCHRRSRRHRTTTPDRQATPAPDRVERGFAPEQIGAPNTLWVADITYVPTGEGWLYLASVLDAFSRRCIGWSMADHLRTELVLAAVELALARRQPPREAGLIHHSDHGCQYTSLAFSQRLQDAGIVPSMGSVGDCYDNAVAESFFATLKGELLDRRDWPTRAAARSAIFEYIEGWYNRQRRHSTLGYVSPAAFEARHQLAQGSMTDSPCRACEVRDAVA
jgi:putative transposase